jgi:uncharacterized HAD superfamily protein
MNVDKILTKGTAVVCDLDGTLAILNGRNPYDASQCETDTLNEELAEVINYLDLVCGHAVIILTGRSEAYREATEQWLKDKGIRYDKLFMRPGEMQSMPAAEFKEIMLDNDILPDYHVYLAFDDMYQVCDMFRRKGIPCWQVNPDPYKLK